VLPGRTVGETPQRTKVAAGWMGEKAGRLKLNGRLLSRSPHSDVLELELRRLGVEGKASCWRTLRTLADTGIGLDPSHLDGLLDRATRQAHSLESLRTATACETVAP